RINASRHEVDFGFLEFYGLKPIAGRFFSRDRPSDALALDRTKPMNAPVVINETAVRTFNFKRPAAAIGSAVWVERYRPEAQGSEIIGVVPDFAVDSIHAKVPPIVYFVDENASNFISVRLAGRDIPNTLARIDRLWDSFETPGPANRLFLDQYVQALYRDVT